MHSFFIHFHFMLSSVETCPILLCLQLQRFPPKLHEPFPRLCYYFSKEWFLNNFLAIEYKESVLQAIKIAHISKGLLLFQWQESGSSSTASNFCVSLTIGISTFSGILLLCISKFGSQLWIVSHKRTVFSLNQIHRATFSHFCNQKGERNTNFALLLMEKTPIFY